MKIYVNGAELLDHFDEADDPIIVERDRQKSRENLKRWLARYAELQECEIRLVWDDIPVDEVLPRGERFGNVEVVNLPYGEEARSEIAGPANRTAVDERTFVVTDDPRLMDSLANGRATVFSPGHFVHRVRRSMGKSDEQLAREPDEKFTGLSEGEVEFWMEFFQEEE